MISVKDLLVQRNGDDVLNIVSLEIQPGETLAVVGPNGAGKSTLLLTLAHLIKPARGEISFRGKTLDDWNDIDYRRKIAFVFQDPLLMDMSVRENIALGMKFRKTKKAEIESQVSRWAKAMGVDQLLGRRAGQLSGGEAQRVSLARAFVLNPELLLMDEPFSAVDPPTRAQLLKDLSEVLSHDQRTTIFVTHNLKEAAQMGHRVAVMIGGVLKQVDTPAQIKSHPADENVKFFLNEF